MEIYVNNIEEKEILLKESKYIHDFMKILKIKTKDGKVTQKVIGLDSDKANTLMHIYMNPDMIKIKK